MITSIAESFGPNLLDNQIATAFLTGIVAETERFSNPKTSPKVMTMSAQLMAAGANQQLVVSKLEPTRTTLRRLKKSLNPNHPKKRNLPKKKQSLKSPRKKKTKGTLSVAHEPTQADGDEVEVDSKEIHIDKQGNLEVIDDAKKAVESESKEPEEEPEEEQTENLERLSLTSSLCLCRRCHQLLQSRYLSPIPLARILRLLLKRLLCLCLQFRPIPCQYLKAT